MFDPSRIDRPLSAAHPTIGQPTIGQSARGDGRLRTAATLAGLLAATLLGASHAAAEDDAAEPLKTRIFLSADKLTAGTQVPFAVRLSVAEGWHVNAQPPSKDYLVPVSVKVRSQAGTKLAEVLYPRGQSLTLGSERIAVYEGQVYLFGKLEVPATAAGQQEELVFETHFQACNAATCQTPETKRITGKIAIVAPGTPVRALNAKVFQLRPQIAKTGTVVR